MLHKSQTYLRTNVSIDSCNEDARLSRVIYSLLLLDCTLIFMVLLIFNLLFKIFLRLLLVLLPLFASLDNELELKHHRHKLWVLDRSQDPVQTDQILLITFVDSLANFEHILCTDVFNNEELVQLFVELFHVVLENRVALETLLVRVIFKFQTVLITELLEESLEVTLLAEGFKSADEVGI